MYMCLSSPVQLILKDPECLRLVRANNTGMIYFQDKIKIHNAAVALFLVTQMFYKWTDIKWMLSARIK